jgi:hypothetical protein
MALILWMYRVIEMLSIDNEQFTLKYLLFYFYDPWLIYLSIITTFNSIWVILMSLFHVINSIFYGVTLNERLTRYRYTYFYNEITGEFRNPFRKQILKNFLEAFGLFYFMSLFRYNRIDWSQIYDINQIHELKLS